MRQHTGFLHQREGTATLLAVVMLLAIITSVFLAGDAWGYASAGELLANGINAGMRSVMAGFDTAFMSDYDLYARYAPGGATEMGQVFRKYLAANLKTAGLVSGSMKKMDIQHAEMQQIYDLSMISVFREQAKEAGSRYTWILLEQEAFRMLKVLAEKFGEQGSADVSAELNGTLSRGFPFGALLQELDAELLLDFFKKLATDMGELTRRIPGKWLSQPSEQEPVSDEEANQVLLAFPESVFVKGLGTDGFLNGVQQLLENGLDKLSLTAYALENLSYFGSGERVGRYFSQGQVEYLLCGERMQLTNLVKVAAEILYIRFLLDTLAFFIRNGDPDPVSGMTAAASEALPMALLETVKLCSGENICFIPTLEGLTAGYRTHLVFLLGLKILFDEDTIVRRMMDMIQADRTWKDPAFRLDLMITGLSCEMYAVIELPFSRLPAGYRRKKEAVYGKPM